MSREISAAESCTSKSHPNILLDGRKWSELGEEKRERERVREIECARVLKDSKAREGGDPV